MCVIKFTHAIYLDRIDESIGDRCSRVYWFLRNAGFIKKGHEVVGLDNLNDYYDPALKRARLAEIERFCAEQSVLEAFEFVEIDIADRAETQALFEAQAFDRVIHLAAQAGVRYSIEIRMLMWIPIWSVL